LISALADALNAANTLTASYLLGNAQIEGKARLEDSLGGLISNH